MSVKKDEYPEEIGHAEDKFETDSLLTYDHV